MEITKQQIQKIIELAGAEFFVDNVDESILSRLLVMIEQKMNFFDIPIELNSKHNLRVLVIDDLELSIYQFTKVLKKIGITPIIARTKEEALAEIKKNSFDYVVADLYLPDLQDGLVVIDEIDKIKNSTKKSCKVIAMSSSDNIVSLNQLVDKIDKFIPKSEKWHEEILRYIAQNLPNDDTPNTNFTKYSPQENTMVYVPLKLNSQLSLKEFIDDFNITLAKGFAKIIINFEKINFFSIEHASIFTDLYKLALSQNKKLILSNINNTIKKILDDIFISEIVVIANSVEDALELT